MFLYKKKNKIKNLFYATKKINMEQKTLKLEKHFKRQMFKFKKKESEMRKFNIATEVSYLSKKIFDLQEIFEEIENSVPTHNPLLTPGEVHAEDFAYTFPFKIQN